MNTTNAPAASGDARRSACPAVSPVPTDSERAAATAMLRIIWGIHSSRAVYAVAKLGIADLLVDGPVSSRELARVTGVHQQSLYRVLRLLAALEVFDEVVPGSFGLTALGDRLRSDVPAGMRSWAVFLEAVGGVEPFAHILDTVGTGKPGLDIGFGMGVFEFLAEHPDSAVIFDAAMSERTAAFASSMADTYDFSDIRSIVDVGGGLGTLLAEILRRHSHLHGTLFEAASVAARAGAVLDGADLADRCAVLTGDFFEQVPRGADCYVLANVLHDWEDERAIDILRNCRQSMVRGGRVLIVERLIPDGPGDAVPTLLSDINMLVITGGQERTNAEYASLLAGAGLKIGAVHPVAFPYGVIEGLSRGLSCHSEHAYPMGHREQRRALAVVRRAFPPAGDRGRRPGGRGSHGGRHAPSGLAGARRGLRSGPGRRRARCPRASGHRR
jgi:O-methyltransferase domain